MSRTRSTKAMAQETAATLSCCRQTQGHQCLQMYLRPRPRRHGHTHLLARYSVAGPPMLLHFPRPLAAASRQRVHRRCRHAREKRLLEKRLAVFRPRPSEALAETKRCERLEPDLFGHHEQEQVLPQRDRHPHFSKRDLAPRVLKRDSQPATVCQWKCQRETLQTQRVARCPVSMRHQS